MELRSRKADVALVGASAALATFGVLIVRGDGQTLLWTLLAITIVAAALWARPHIQAFARSADTNVVSVTSRGIEQTGPAGREMLAWTSLTEVAIIATIEGPSDEDLYLVLRGEGEHGLVIPHTEAVDAGLLIALAERLHGFDNDAYARGLTSAEDTIVTIWRSPRLATAPVATTPRSARESLALAY
jgi:hypothetical protein